MVFLCVFQLAITTPPYGECWNPTEAGGRTDFTGDETKSVIQSIDAAENAIKTTVAKRKRSPFVHCMYDVRCSYSFGNDVTIVRMRLVLNHVVDLIAVLHTAHMN